MGLHIVLAVDLLFIECGLVKPLFQKKPKSKQNIIVVLETTVRAPHPNNEAV